MFGVKDADENNNTEDICSVSSDLHAVYIELKLWDELQAEPGRETPGPSVWGGKTGINWWWLVCSTQEDVWGR